MSNKKDHQNIDKMDSCYKLVQQSSDKGGIRAADIAVKLGIHKTTVYDQLNHLQFGGKIYSDQGLWKATTDEKTIKPLEKEIEIVFPLPKKDWQKFALLENFARDWEKSFPDDKNNLYRITLEKFNETRTIKIKGKNVDDLDLEKVAKLIEQANEKSSNFNLKGILKKLKI